MQEYRASRQQPPTYETPAFFILLLVCALQFFVIAYLLIVAGAIPRFEGKSSPTDAVLVLLTFSYVVVNGVILGVLYRQLQATETSNYLTLRAWLTVARVKRIQIIAGANQVIEIETHNPGGLPATAIKGASRIALLRVPFDWPSAPDPTDFEALVLGPGQYNTLSIEIPSISVDDIRAIVERRLAVILSVTWAYTDPIGSVGRTEIVAEYLPDRWTFSPAPKGNAME